ncbi:MAG: XRE family transcriptional regulator [Tannerella sp.]|nr:XRE family transcriptional regulator [Tannerella sp.]
MKQLQLSVPASLQKRKELHIGRLIREKAETEGYSACRLAKRLHCDRSNIYKLYRKRTIDAEFLLQISIALNYDFFRYYSDCFRQDTE